MTEENEVPKPASKNFRSFKQVVGDLGMLFGPATIIGVVCQIFDFTPRVTAEITIAVFLLTTIVFFSSFLERRLPVVIPACVAVILGAVLMHILLTPRQIPADDPWVAWQRQVEKSVAECGNEKTIHEICLAQAISHEYPKPKSSFSTELLHNELHAGAIIMTINPVKELLYKRIGVKDHFVGNGFAQPGDRGKADAFVPEYLAANLSDAHPDVWTWALAPIPEHLDKKVSEIVGSRKDTIGALQARDSEGFTKFLQTVMNHLDYERPAVIRFARFPPEQYSQKMGRLDAKRVFVLHLGSVYNLSLGEAARLSGYSLESARSDHDKLWVWVYLPGDKRDLVRPTWGEIITNLKGWLVAQN